MLLGTAQSRLVDKFRAVCLLLSTSWDSVPIGRRETDQMHLLLIASNPHAATLLAIRIEWKCDRVNRLRASHLDS